MIFPPFPSPAELESLMVECLNLAAEAAKKGEVPVGALLWEAGSIIAKAHNEIESRQDPTAHAELLVIQKAAISRSNWRLSNCVLIASLEPCTMCSGAILQSHLGSVVYGASDPRFGACGSLYDLLSGKGVRLIEGIKASESATLLRNFFSTIRK